MCALRPRKKLPAAETRPSRAASKAIFQAFGTAVELLFAVQASNARR